MQSDHPHHFRAPVSHGWIGALALLMAAAILCPSSVASAQALDVLHSFSSNTDDGAFPVAGLTLGSDGNLYGSTSAGGVHGLGTIFRMSPSGDVVILYSFRGYSSFPYFLEGGIPMSELVEGSDGWFYGHTSPSTSQLTTFRVNVDGVEAPFPGSRWVNPRSAITRAPDGQLFDTFTQAVCSVKNVLLDQAFLLNISRQSCIVHQGMLGTLVYATGGDFYGTASYGGAYDKGVVFRWNPSGVNEIVHSFGAGDEGIHPNTLMQAADGNFYGTTASGGPLSQGTIFRMAPDGAVTVLYAFTGAVDGGGPTAAPLIQASDGDFYGIVPGGALNKGVAFRINASGVFTILHTFSGGAFDGAYPQSRLLQMAGGTFYGTTTRGGVADLGTVFTLTPSGAFSVLHSFGTTAAGKTSVAPLLQANDGNFYGTTSAGAAGFGTVFRMTPAGAVSTLHGFAGGSADGANPEAALIQARDGALYGTTRAGGLSGFGTVFRMFLDGTFTLLHSFTGCSPSCQPTALVEADDGSLLGVTAAGGTAAGGTVFRVTPGGGTAAVLHDFLGGATDGRSPSGALLKAPDRSFYGTAMFGGMFNNGIVYRITATGTFTVLHSFTGGAGGANPAGALTLASDGQLYGTTLKGLAGDGGTAFRMTLNGSLVTMHRFQAATEGSQPRDLVQATDGRLYGTMTVSGRLKNGTLFNMTLAGEVAVVAVPAVAEGAGPSRAVIQGVDGYLYGTMRGGGAYDGGVVFRLRPTAPPHAPTAVSVTAGLARIGLSWMSVATAVSYTVKRVGPSGGVTILSSGLTSPTFTDLTVANGQTYHYVVSALNASGESVDSYDVTATAGRGVLGDFDGDGKADITVFRPSIGTWSIRQSSTGSGNSYVWGGSDDIPVHADYDGDGKTDIAVFRPSIGTWYIRNSGTPTSTVVVWGGGDDVPVPADYDGDGTTDIAVFRPSTGTWYVRNTRTPTSTIQVWGGGGDVPLPADYDGDGRADIAVFRPSTGMWFIRNTGTPTSTTLAWGGGSDIPVPADYDGDGKAEIAVFRPATGTWYIRNSATPTSTTQMWGIGSDVPAPGDYDGDGRTDIAVFRPSTGTWYIRNTATPTSTTQVWGQSGDIPNLKRP